MVIVKKPRLLNVEQAAEELTVSPRTVYRLISDGELPALKVRGSLRVSEDSIEAYLFKQLDRYSEKVVFCVTDDDKR